MNIQCEPRHFFSEGVRLAADIYSPPGPVPAAGRPAVVMCHGYNGMKHLYLPDAARRLAARGYVVLCFDYKGWGQSEGPHRRLDPYGRVADVRAALTILAAEPGVAPERIGLFGWSFGCATAVWTAAVDSRVKAVVGVVGVGDGERWLRSVWSQEEWQRLEADACDDRLERARTGNSRFVERGRILFLDPASRSKAGAARSAGGVTSDEIPLEYFDETLAFRPEWIVDKVSPRPLLLISCSEDRVSPPQEMQKLFDAALEPKRLVKLDGYDHYDVYAGAAFDLVMDETLAWFAPVFAPTAP